MTDVRARTEDELHGPAVGVGRVARWIRGLLAQPAWKHTQRELAAFAEQPLPARWLAHVNELRQVHAFDERRAAKFRADLSVLCHALPVVSSEPTLHVVDRMRVVLCGAAALLVTGRGPHWFDHISHFDVRRDASRRGDHEVSGQYHGKAHPLLGVAGYVQVAWSEVEYDVKVPDDGNNVVLHELAHAIDHRFGGLLLQRDARVERWRDATRELASTWSTAPGVEGAELFAIATELLFERPRDLRAQEPELYAELVAIYAVDPITW